MTRKRLPIGIPTFRTIREEDCDLTPEEGSNTGRLDLALRFNGQVYLFEFKVVELAPEGRALARIKERGDADPWRGQGVPIHRIGVAFSRERRTVVGFAVQTVRPDPRHRSAKNAK